MGRVCKGGFLDGTQIYTAEDQGQCINGGGTVQDTGGGGCGASALSALAFQGRGESSQSRGGLESISLAPLRRLRDLMGGHPAVAALLAVNKEAAREIERIAASDQQVQGELISAFVLLTHMAEHITAPTPGPEIYTQQIHDRLAHIGKEVAIRSRVPALHQAVEHVIAAAAPFIGQSAAQIAATLSERGAAKETHERTATFLSSAFSLTANQASAGLALSDPRATLLTEASRFHLGDFIAFEKALKEIEAKAKALGGLPGNPLGSVREVPGGYVGAYQGCDIYFTPTDGAHEVHGDIRAKYNAVGGPSGALGLPVTDETGTPDGVGRYNHFQGGSVYWTPHTGPMIVRGRVRDLWASQGWERGALGYPVADYYHLPPLFYPQDNPDLAWCVFENGAILSQGNSVAQAQAAELGPDALRGLIRAFFDRSLHQANGDLGLQAQVDLVGVSGWSYGFWGAVPRTITYRLYGFHGNGLLPDTDFTIEIRLRFGLAWGMLFSYPGVMTLTASLDWLHVHTSGLGAQTLADGLFNGIHGTFFRGGPDPNHNEVPDGSIFMTTVPTGVSQRGAGAIDFVTILLTAQGGLQFLVNPLPPSIGGLRKLIAQNQINAFAENF